MARKKKPSKKKKKNLAVEVKEEDHTSAENDERMDTSKSTSDHIVQLVLIPNTLHIDLS